MLQWGRPASLQGRGWQPLSWCAQVDSGDNAWGCAVVGHLTTRTRQHWVEWRATQWNNEIIFLVWFVKKAVSSRARRFVRDSGFDQNRLWRSRATVVSTMRQHPQNTTKLMVIESGTTSLHKPCREMVFYDAPLFAVAQIELCFSGKPQHPQFDVGLRVGGSGYKRSAWANRFRCTEVWPRALSYYCSAWNYLCAQTCWHEMEMCVLGLLLLFLMLRVFVQCCDRKARAASAQSFTLRQQATVENQRSRSAITQLLLVRATYMRAILRAHPVRSELHIQRPADREVAAAIFFWHIWLATVWIPTKRTWGSHGRQCTSSSGVVQNDNNQLHKSVEQGFFQCLTLVTFKRPQLFKRNTKMVVKQGFSVFWFWS